jgi:ATP-binding cassette subfamily C (CFTR/MRP) protein 1
LHAKLFAGVAHSPLSFFEGTSEGDITSRFAGDTDAIDSQLPGLILGITDGILSIVTGLLVVIGAAPIFLVALPVLAYCYRWVAIRYRAPAKALKSMDNQTKGPILSLISESLDGVASVRCYGLQSRVFDEFCRRLDDNNRARYSWDAANRWLSVRLELVGSGIVGAAALAAVLGASAIGDKNEAEGLGGGATLAGLAISSAMFATRSLSYTVRSLTGLEQQLNSLQRVVAFARLPPEPETTRHAVAEDQKALQEWPPDSGCDIELSEVVATYIAGTESRNALDLTSRRSGKAKSVRIYARQRVGVCGRSGSGKSTLAKVLCRVLNPVSGIVKIGGVDTATIPLKRLRSTVCVVPQTASVGDGGATIRTVIDPGGREDEQAIWQALTLVGMQQTVDLTKGGLDEPVDKNRWSAGEMQLLVLARAALRQPLVLILDESCAHLDDANSERIRDLLRYGDCFARTTIVVIAHRLTDIGACDRVL